MGNTRRVRSNRRLVHVRTGTVKDRGALVFWAALGLWETSGYKQILGDYKMSIMRQGCTKRLGSARMDTICRKLGSTRKMTWG